MIIERRTLLTGIGALFITAPAIVRASSLMAINPALTPPLFPAKIVFATSPVPHEPVERMRLTASGLVIMWQEAPQPIEVSLGGVVHAQRGTPLDRIYAEAARVLRGVA